MIKFFAVVLMVGFALPSFANEGVQMATPPQGKLACVAYAGDIPSADTSKRLEVGKGDVSVEDLNLRPQDPSIQIRVVLFGNYDGTLTIKVVVPKFPAIEGANISAPKAVRSPFAPDDASLTMGTKSFEVKDYLKIYCVAGS